MTVFVFDYGAWILRFPEFSAAVSPPLAAAYFAEATLYVSNDDCSRVQDATQRALILNLTTAHIAALNAPVNEGESQSLVGRISNASEGSVSVATELKTPDSAAWWAQTKYGLQAWQAMRPFCMGVYVPAPRR
jgi:hypothetical protein